MCYDEGASGDLRMITALCSGKKLCKRVDFSGTHEKLSTKKIVDCVPAALGRGFISKDAFSYIFNSGITHEYFYPSKLVKRGRCKRNEEHPRERITGYNILEPNDEENLKIALHLIGQISVSMFVTSNFFFYRSGVFYDLRCTDGEGMTNHAVLLVGYGANTVGVITG